MIAPGLHLCLPGALGPLPAGAAPLLDAVSVPDLLRLLAGARAASGIGDWLASARPAANGRAAAHAAGLAPGRWCLAAPLQLIPDRDTLQVRGPGALHLQRSEAEALAEALTAFDADAGIEVVVLTAERWLVRVPEDWRIPDLPGVEGIVGRRYGEALPLRADAWVAWLNALQMVLWSSPVSVAREARGLPRVSGLWVWGDGPLPGAGAAMPDRLYCEDPALRGLVSLAGGEALPLPAGAEALLAALQPGLEDQCVVAILPPLPTVQDPAGFSDWTAALEALVQDWVRPLQAALRRSELPALGVHVEVGREWLCRPGDRFRFWKRSPGLAALCLFETERAS